MKPTFKLCLSTLAGSILFALGFALFLEPNHINTGGISGLAMVFVHVLGKGTVGIVSVCMNIPLFFFGGIKIGKRFFIGSLLGMLTSSLMIDYFDAAIHVPGLDPLLGAIYGGVLCGIGLGMVFAAGSSTGGSDIIARLLKSKWRNVPIGIISTGFDAAVVVLTGIVFRDVYKALYSGIAVFLTGQVLDIVVYRFDYSKVAFIITDYPVEIANTISIKLDRGATFLHGQGSYTQNDREIILTVVKKRQLAELKELIMEIDKNAFVIVQEAHQVLGDGFARYSRDSL